MPSGLSRPLEIPGDFLPFLGPCYQSSRPGPHTDHFPLGAEEGVTLQALALLALGDVREHLVVHLVRGAVGDPGKWARSITRPAGHTSHLDVPLLGPREPAAWSPPGQASVDRALAS